MDREYDIRERGLVAFSVVLIVCFASIAYYIAPRPASQDSGPVYTMFVATSFVNLPKGNITRNGDGWIVTAITMNEGKVALKDLYISLTRNDGVPIFNQKGIDTETSNISQSAKSPHWFLTGEGNQYFTDQSSRTRLSIDNEGEISEDALTTLENTTIVFVDKKDFGHFNQGDYVLVFKDNNADGHIEVDLGYHIKFSMKGATISEITLN